MTVKDAVAKRFEQLCDQRGIRPNELATRAGVTPSTVYSMLDPSRQRVSIVTIKKLCDGLDITLGQFFSCALFDELEQEIQSLTERSARLSLQRVLSFLSEF